MKRVAGKKRKASISECSDEQENLEEDGQLSVLFPTRPRSLSSHGNGNHSKSKKNQRPGAVDPGTSASSQDLSLMEQLEEKKKDFQHNFAKEVNRLKKEISELTCELRQLQESLSIRRENVRQVLQIQEQLKTLQQKLQFLLSGKCKQLFQKRLNEFNEHHRIDPMECLPLPKTVEKMPVPSPPQPLPSPAPSADLEQQLMFKLGFYQKPKPSPKSKELWLEEDDPFFSHFNLQGDSEAKAREQLIPPETSFAPEREEEKEMMQEEVPPEYDIANILYLPRNHSACIQQAASQPSTEEGKQRLFCNCGLPMFDKYDIGKIFCLQCGLSREFQDMLPTYPEENQPRAPPVHTKKNSQISAVLNPFRPIPFVTLPDTPFDCLRKERQLQIIRGRRPVNDEHVKNILQKNGLAKLCYPHRNQITTHFTGMPPPEYLTPEKDAYWTSTLQKNPSYIAEYRTYCKRSMLEKFQSGGITLNLIEYLEKMHPPTQHVSPLPEFEESEEAGENAEEEEEF